MTRVVAVVFGLLVVATFAAFFVTQRLKSEPSIVGHVRVMEFFSPNGDGTRDVETISFRVKETDDVTATIVDADGDAVRDLGSRRAQRYQPQRYDWDGRDDDGERAPDGTYRVRVNLADQGRSVVLTDPIRLDTKPPRLAVRAGVLGDPEQHIFRPGTDTVSARLPPISPFTQVALDIYRTDVRPIRRVVSLDGQPGQQRINWDGMIDQRPAPQGTYLLAPRVTDRAGNEGASPTAAQLRDPAGLVGELSGRPGLMARELAAQVPVTPVRAGERFEVTVDSRGRSYRWRLRRVGVGKTGGWKRGVKAPKRLKITAPDHGRSAVYLLELAIGGTMVSLPIPVQAQQRADVLVVLPATTWLGEDAVDLDRDGLPDRLDLGPGSRTPVQRVRNGLPARFGDDIGAPLAFLDRAGMRYDVTTDIALAEGEELTSDRNGVLLLGQARWQPVRAARKLRRYALRGGRVGVLAPGGLRSTATLRDGILARPTAPARSDLFGTRVEESEPYEPWGNYPEPPHLVAAPEDELGLFEATDGTIAAPPQVERVLSPGPRATKVLAQAAQEVRAGEAAPGVPEDPDNLSQAPDQAAPSPVVLAARVGRGIVIRTGLPGFAATLCEGSDVTRAQLMRNIFDVLRRVQPKARDAAQGCGREPTRKPTPKRKRRRR